MKIENLLKTRRVNMEEAGSFQVPETPSERKLIYLKLLNKCEVLDENEAVNLDTIREVDAVFKEANRLQREIPIEERVHHTEETFLDCKVIRSASALTVKCIEAVDINVATYDPSEFGKALRDSVSPDDEYTPVRLLKLLDFVQEIIPPLPKDNGLYGAVDLQKVREIKARKKKELFKRANEDKKKPELVERTDEGEEKIYKIVRNMHKILTEEYRNNNGEPLDYYNYVVDTSDFGKTIENIFYTSFLIREGKAAIDLTGPNGTTAVLRPVKKNELEAFKGRKDTYSQIVTSISMEEWKKFKNEGLLQRRRNLGLDED